MAVPASTLLTSGTQKWVMAWGYTGPHRHPAAHVPWAAWGPLHMDPNGPLGLGLAPEVHSGRRGARRQEAAGLNRLATARGEGTGEAVEGL